MQTVSIILHSLKKSIFPLKIRNSSLERKTREHLDILPYLFQYEDWYGASQPQFTYQHPSHPNQPQEAIIRRVKEINNLPIGKDLYDVQIPDTLIHVNDESSSGFDLNIVVNNVINPFIHRHNGFSFFKQRYWFLENMYARHQTHSFLTPTEAYISVGNLFQNAHLQTKLKTKGSFPNIVSIVSPATDNGIILQFVSGIITLCLNFLLPVTFSASVPVMLATLVSEREGNIKELMRVNGVSFKTYSFGNFVYFCLLILKTAFCFFLFGKFFINIEYFKETSLIVQSGFYLIWSASQVSQILLLSLFISSSFIAKFIGYLLSICAMLVLILISAFVFPLPRALPALALLNPQASLARYIFVSLNACLKGNDTCLKGFDDVLNDEELRRVFFYCGLSIILNFSLIFLKANFSLAKFKSALFTNGNFKHEIEAEIGTKKDENNTSEDGEDKSYQDKMDEVNFWDPEYQVVIKNVKKTYKKNFIEKKALQGISLTIKKGENLFMVGSNGAGKTTLISIIIGSLSPDSGFVQIGGKKIKKGADLKGISYCNQFDVLWPNLTILEHLKIASSIKGIKNNKKQLFELLDQLELTEHRNKKTKELSGGLRRRCSLGFALVGNPELLILDEPTSNLDLVQRSKFLRLLKKVMNGRAIIYTTHLMNEIEALKGNVMFIDKGRVIEYGTTSYLRKKYEQTGRFDIFLKQNTDFLFLKKNLEIEIQKNFGKESVEHNLVVLELHQGGVPILKMKTELRTVFVFLKSNKEEITNWKMQDRNFDSIFFEVLKRSRNLEKLNKNKRHSDIALQKAVENENDDIRTEIMEKELLGLKGGIKSTEEMI